MEPATQAARTAFSLIDEFKKFAFKGNVVDLAVGVIIGAAFGAIVSSLVADLIMPIIGAATGGLDFSNYYAQLTGPKVAAGTPLADAKKAGAVLAWGNFLTIVINFLIIAWILFMLVKASNKLRRETPAPPPGPTPTEKLLGEIRDLLKNK